MVHTPEMKMNELLNEDDEPAKHNGSFSEKRPPARARERESVSLLAFIQPDSHVQEVRMRAEDLELQL